MFNTIQYVTLDPVALILTQILSASTTPMLLSLGGQDVPTSTVISSHFSSSVAQLKVPITVSPSFHSSSLPCWIDIIVVFSPSRGAVFDVTWIKVCACPFSTVIDLMYVSCDPQRGTLSGHVRRQRNTKSQRSTSHLANGGIISVATGLLCHSRADPKPDNI